MSPLTIFAMLESMLIHLQREFILRYEDLDNRLDPNRGVPRTAPFPPAS